MKPNNKNILTIITTAFLVVALSDGLPYGYFTLLRFIVCIVGVYLAYKIYEDNKKSLLVWVFGFIAILFNPIIVIQLQREQWWVIDLVVGIFFVLSIFLVKTKIRND
ncbi:MAG: DUF6804 family protein [Minisyncoccota bacterium]